MSYLVGGVVLFFVFLVLRWMVQRAFGSAKTVAVLTPIDNKANEDAKSIVKTAEAEKLEVASAKPESILQRVRARVARGLRK